MSQMVDGRLVTSISVVRSYVYTVDVARKSDSAISPHSPTPPLILTRVKKLDMSRLSIAVAFEALCLRNGTT